MATDKQKLGIFGEKTVAKLLNNHINEKHCTKYHETKTCT